MTDPQPLLTGLDAPEVVPRTAAIYGALDAHFEEALRLLGDFEEGRVDPSQAATRAGALGQALARFFTEDLPEPVIDTAQMQAEWQRLHAVPAVKRYLDSLREAPNG